MEMAFPGHDLYWVGTVFEAPPAADLPADRHELLGRATGA
jgi:hypothetical protein